MTGYQSKRAMAQDKLITGKEHGITHYAHLLMVKCFNEEHDKHRRKTTDDIAYQSGYYDGKKAALAGREWNFCERCGKRTKDIHTCTPPQRTWVGLTAEEAAECWTTSATHTWRNFEAKLKEKNT